MGMLLFVRTRALLYYRNQVWYLYDVDGQGIGETRKVHTGRGKQQRKHDHNRQEHAITFEQRRHSSPRQT
jgi:hypothetical protein